jgi:hypothetical protein
MLFRNRLFWVLKWVVLAQGTSWLLRKYAAKYCPGKIFWALVLLVCHFKHGQFNADMAQACHRMKTDTLTNYYDGLNTLPNSLIPEYLPKKFERGEEFINIKHVKCKLRAWNYVHCWGYYTNTMYTSAVWGSQSSCGSRNSASRSEIFKK